MGICAYDDFYSQLTRMQMVIGSIGIVMIIIASIAVGLTMLLSLKPLKNVKEAISDVATGDADLTKRITKRGNDEIADVVVDTQNFKEELDSLMDIQNISELITEQDLENTTYKDILNKEIYDIKDNINNLDLNAVELL